MLLFLILSTVSTTLFSLHRLWQGSLHFLPSLGWSFFMALPLCAEYPLINPATQTLQAAAVLLILAFLFAGDLVADRFIKNNSLPMTKQANVFSLRLASFIAVVFVGMTVWHLLQVPSIPLFDALFRHNDPLDITNARNAFTRDYAGGAVIRYLLNFSLNILAVPAIILFFINDKRSYALALLLWAVFYAVASTAKSPLAMGMLVILVTSLALWPLSTRLTLQRVTVAGGLCALTLLIVVNVFQPYAGPLKNLPEKYENPAISTITNPAPHLGDSLRVAGIEETGAPPGIIRKIDYLLYRIFLTPVEVSARWYEYFHFYPLRATKFTRLIDDTRTGQPAHPANAVGIWAYHDPYPEHYTTQVYAYASLDADAFARFGKTGVLVASLLLLGLRVWFALFNDMGGPTRGVFYACALAHLCYLPASASIQALLIAQGLSVLALLMALITAQRLYRAHK